MLNNKTFKDSGILICSFFLMTNCNHNPKDAKEIRKEFHYRNDTGLLVKRTYYEELDEELDKEMNILTEKTFKVKNIDTVLHGYAKSFYQNGQLMGEEYYIDGVKHGVTQQFYPNGKIKHKGWFKNDKLDSIGIAYYEDGQIETKGYFRKGVKIGEQVFYYPSGKVHKYLFNDPLGRLIYRKEYANDGAVLNENGEQNPQLIYKGDDAEFFPNETLQVTIYAPTPPDSEVSLYINIKDKGGQDVVDSRKVPIKNGKAIYNRELNELGQYYFKISLFFRDIKSGKKETFYNSFEFKVIPAPQGL